MPTTQCNIFFCSSYYALHLYTAVAVIIIRVPMKEDGRRTGAPRPGMPGAGDAGRLPMRGWLM